MQYNRNKVVPHTQYSEYLLIALDCSIWQNNLDIFSSRYFPPLPFQKDHSLRRRMEQNRKHKVFYA